LMVAGAQWCEILVEDVASWRLLCDDHKTNVRRASRLGVSVYAVASGKSFHTCCDGTSAESIDRITDAVCASLRREGGRGGSSDVSPHEVSGGAVQDVIEPLGDVELSRRLDVVKEADSAAWESHPRIKQVSVVYADRVRRAEILTSEGRIVHDNRSMVELAVRAFLRVNGEIWRSFGI